jgi:DNA-binding NarL/FixJ family response regulator
LQFVETKETESAERIQIFLVDDHPIVRRGLELVLRREPDLAVAGEAANAEEGWVQIEQLKPDVVIADVQLPGESGIALARRIRLHLPETRVIMLTGHTEPPIVDEALDAGVVGYLLKFNPPGDLLAAIRGADAGQIHLSPEVSSAVVLEYRRKLKADNAASRLTDREREILKRIADGNTTKEIAFALRVSAKTIETHRLNIMAKVGVRSVAELTKYAVREGITHL